MPSAIAMHATENTGNRLWLSDADWRMVQENVPVVCVDVLPFKTNKGAKQVGLIYRETPHQGRRWCLIGGRILRNEPCRAAVLRHIEETLGPAAQCVLSEPIRPIYVGEYFSEQRDGHLFDPRQHSVALTFFAQLRGMIVAMGEALDFAWFDTGKLPTESEFGFGQAKVVEGCLRSAEF
jgi:ADP-ribose pyrophosphatase YjhB (NUDIX family)